jgi:hypothetical protein
MLALYGVGDTELEELLSVARETRQRGWWQPYGSILTGAYVGFEAAADRIRSYEAQCVPGLLQTADYARSMIAAVHTGRPRQEVDDRVHVRLGRQALLTQEDPVQFWCVLDEAALRRPVGGREVMRCQLEHLVRESARPNVTVQVLPMAAGEHPGMEGSFVIMSFPDAADPDTVYVTIATGGVFQEKPDDVSRYEIIFDRLQKMALSSAESAEFIATMAKEP